MEPPAVSPELTGVQEQVEPRVEPVEREVVVDPRPSPTRHSPSRGTPTLRRQFLADTFRSGRVARPHSRPESRARPEDGPPHRVPRFSRRGGAGEWTGRAGPSRMREGLGR